MESEHDGEDELLLDPPPSLLTFSRQELASVSAVSSYLLALAAAEWAIWTFASIDTTAKILWALGGVVAVLCVPALVIKSRAVWQRARAYPNVLAQLKRAQGDLGATLMRNGRLSTLAQFLVTGYPRYQCFDTVEMVDGRLQLLLFPEPFGLDGGQMAVQRGDRFLMVNRFTDTIVAEFLYHRTIDEGLQIVEEQTYDQAWGERLRDCARSGVLPNVGVVGFILRAPELPRE